MSNKTKRIATIKIEGQEISIRASEHCIQRMQQRGISEYVIAGNIIALGDRLAEIQNTNEEGIIIDQEHKMAVVFGFKPGAPNTCFIITCINKSNVFIKTGTRLFEVPKVA